MAGVYRLFYTQRVNTGAVNRHRHSNHSNISNNSPWEGPSCCGSSYNNVSTETSGEEVAKHRVVLLGDAGVGKTALVSQFMTSEYMNTYDASLGKGSKLLLK